ATAVPAPTLSLSGALPSGVTFNATTGVLSGTPAAGTVGSYPLTFTASNGVGGNATQKFTLTVSLVLAAPVVTSPAANAAVAAPPTFTWQAVAGATSYNVRVDDLSGGVSWFVWQPGVTGTSYTATTLVPNRSYRLWLQAVGQGGGGSW